MQAKLKVFLLASFLSALTFFSCNTTEPEPEDRIQLTISDKDSSFFKGDSLRFSLLGGDGDSTVLFQGPPGDSAKVESQAWDTLQLGGRVDLSNETFQVKVEAFYAGSWQPIRTYRFVPRQKPTKEVILLVDKKNPDPIVNPKPDTTKIDTTITPRPDTTATPKPDTTKAPKPDTTKPAPTKNPARILKDPQSLVVKAGQPARFTVIAEGRAPLSFQWMKGAASLSAKDSVLSVASASASDTGRYRVIVSNSDGADTSAMFSLMLETEIRYTLTVAPAVKGKVEVTGGLKPSYAAGEMVTLTAKPDSGHVFVGWLGDTTSSSPSLTLSMTKNRSLSANFQKIGTYTLTLAASPAEGGTVTKKPNTQTHEFESQVEVSASADAAKGYQFVKWQEGTTSSSSNPLTVKVDSHKSLTALFEKKKYALSLVTDGHGSLSSASLQAVHGEPLSLPQPLAAADYVFERWVVDSGMAKLSDSASLTLAKAILTAPARLKALFKGNPPQAPTLLEVSIASATSVQVDYAPVSRASSYTLYYKAGGGAFKVGDAGVAKVPEFAVKGAVAGLAAKGTYTFALVAVNAAGESLLSETKTVVLNRKPVLETLTDKSVAENTAVSFTVKATDPDGGNPSLSLTGGPTGASFNASTGVFTWTPGYDESNRTTNKSYTLTFKADDGSEQATATLTLTVTHVNRPPELVVTGDGSLAGTVELGRLYQDDLEARDPDGDPLTVTYIQRPEGLEFDLAGKKVRWNVDRAKFLADFSIRTVDLEVGDGLAKVKQKWTISITPRQWQLVKDISSFPSGYQDFIAFGATDSNTLYASIYNVAGTAAHILKSSLPNGNFMPTGIEEAGHIGYLYGNLGALFYGGNTIEESFARSSVGNFSESFVQGELFLFKRGAGGNPIVVHEYIGGSEPSFYTEHTIAFLDESSPQRLVQRDKAPVRDLQSFSNGMKLFLSDNIYRLENGAATLASNQQATGIETDFLTQNAVYLINGSNKLLYSPSSNPLSFTTTPQSPSTVKKIHMLSPKVGWATSNGGTLYFTNSGWMETGATERFPGGASVETVFFSGDGKTVFAITTDKKIYRY